MPTYTAPGVYIEEVASSEKVLSAAPTAIAAFVGFTASYPTDDPKDPLCLGPRLVTSWTQFEQLFGGFCDPYILPLSVYGYFQNGGSIAYICRVPNSVPSETPSQLALPAPDKKLGQPLTVTSVEPDADVTVTVSQQDAPEGAPEGPNPFTITIVPAHGPVEVYADLTLGTAVKTVNASKTVQVTLNLDAKTDLSKQIDVLKPGTYALEKNAPTPTTPTGRSFAGSESQRSGINGLALAPDVTMVLVPDLATAARKADGTYDLDLWKSVQTSLITHCELQANRMAILDPPPPSAISNVQQMADWRANTAMYDSQFAALYYPWVVIENPIGSNGNSRVTVPPSGHVAGLWARTDESRGVWKAPANDILRGVLDVSSNISQTEQGLLNPDGINCIRTFGTRGIRVWGARTLSSDTDWRYINVRRLFNMVETAIMDGTQYVVFEPNDMNTWEGVKRTLTGFLLGLYQQGALFGASPEQAFYVKCDAETNPPNVINEGKLIVEVGIAPVKPAEFVVFRISQLKQTAS